MELVIREAVIDDASALRDYAERLFAEDLPGVFRRPVPTLDEEVAFIRSRIEPVRSTALVALVDDAPVGLIDLIGSDLLEQSHVGTFGISVDRSARGGGVGTSLLVAMLEWADAHAITRVQAEVCASNPRALAFYERNGFEREGVCKGAVIRDGQAIDLVMIARVRAPKLLP